MEEKRLHQSLPWQDCIGLSVTAEPPAIAGGDINTSGVRVEANPSDPDFPYVDVYQDGKLIYCPGELILIEGFDPETGVVSMCQESEDLHFKIPYEQYVRDFGTQWWSRELEEKIEQGRTRTNKEAFAAPESVVKDIIDRITAGLDRELKKFREQSDEHTKEFIDICAEARFPAEYYPDHTLVVWGEEGFQDDYFSVHIFVNDMDGLPDRPIMETSAELDDAEDFTRAVNYLFDRFAEAKFKQFEKSNPGTTSFAAKLSDAQHRAGGTAPTAEEKGKEQGPEL